MTVQGICQKPYDYTNQDISPIKYINTILPIYISSLLNDDSATIVLIRGKGEWIPQKMLYTQ